MKLLPLIAILAVTTSTAFSARIVCYYTNWSRYGNAPFKVEDIDPTLCTHIVYSFFGLDNDGKVDSVDYWNDFGDEWTEGAIPRFMRLKNKNPSVKLLLGVGGWNQGPSNFQAMVKSPEKRKAFLETSLNYIRRFNFDGLEICWMYQGALGTPEDKAGLSELVKEIKLKFVKNKYLLSVATTANPTVFDSAYDIRVLSDNVDFINVLSYDFHGSWDMKTGHVAPLHAMKNESPSEQHLNVEAVINRYIQKGASPQKLNVGLVGYGRTYTLTNPNNFGPNAPAKGPGKEEPLPYSGFCVQDMSELWKKYRIEGQAVPYAVQGDQWVGYEDVNSLKDKIKFVKSKKLQGVTFWSLDFDDFKGNCKTGKFPLLRAINEEMKAK